MYRQIRYHEPVFRPPSEAYSAIIQATIGCTWNRCHFCEMYSSKNFSTRSLDEIKNDIEILSGNNDYRRVFLADGNAFVLSANKLIPILDEINSSFQHLQRISAYALPRDILSKTEKELAEIRGKGLKLLYIGLESGDDDVLKLINKGETFQSSVDGLLKAKNAGLDVSIMILNGLGGRKYSEQHAIHSAEIVNITQPKYLSTLTLSFPFGLEHFQSKLNEPFQRLTIKELLQEQKLLIEQIHQGQVIFRSNHVSNNLNLEGVLPKDKQSLIAQLEKAIIACPDNQFPFDSGLF